MRKENPSEYGKKGMKEMLEPQYEEWFCGNCGTAKKQNTVVYQSGDRLLTCTDCNIVLRFYIVSPATKSKKEAEESFNKTELTKQQRTGSGNKPYKKRKKKRKKSVGDPYTR
jgi:hypothetical protein